MLAVQLLLCEDRTDIPRLVRVRDGALRRKGPLSPLICTLTSSRATMFCPAQPNGLKTEIVWISSQTGEIEGILPDDGISLFRHLSQALRKGCRHATVKD